MDSSHPSKLKPMVDVNSYAPDQHRMLKKPHGCSGGLAKSLGGSAVHHVTSNLKFCQDLPSLDEANPLVDE